MADFAVNIILKAKDDASPVIRQVLGTAKSTAREFGKVRGKTRMSAAEAAGLTPTKGKGKDQDLAGLIRTANISAAAAGMRQVGDAAKGMVMAPLELAANFEASRNKVIALSGGVFATTGQIEEMEKKARELGATTEFTATNAMDAFGLLTQAGLTYEQQMGSIATVLDFATAGQVEMADAADLLAGAMGGFGFQAKTAEEAMANIQRIGDVMARTAQSTNTDITQMGNAFNYVAPAAAQLGISLEDTSAALAVLGKSRIRGTAAGTALRSIFTALGSPTKGPQKQALRAMGLTQKQMRAAMETGDIANPLQLMVDAMAKKKITGTKRTTILNAMFGERRAAQADLLMKSLEVDQSDEASWKSLSAAVRNTEKTLAQTADTMRQGTTGAAKTLMSSLEELGIVAGKELQPVANDLIAWATDATREFAAWAKENPELVRRIGKMAIGLAAVSTVAVPLLTTIATMNSLLRTGAVAFQILGWAAKTKAGQSLLAVKTTIGGLNMGDLIGSKAGLVGLLGAAAGAAYVGYEFGKWADETLGLSDKLAGLNHLTEEQIGLQMALANVRGEVAFLGDLTDDERKAMDDAKKRQEQLFQELENISGFKKFMLGDDATLFGFQVGDRGTAAIEEDIAKEQRLIERINQKAIERKNRMRPAPTIDEAKAAQTDAQTEAMIDKINTSRLGGELKITIDNQGRASARVLEENDLTFDIDTGVNTEGY